MRKMVRQLFVVSSLLMACPAVVQGGEWLELKSRHFVVHHSGDSAYAKKALAAAERLYREIAADLGFPRHDKMWLWDNRAAIRIYSTRKDFIAATGAPQWAGGKASQARKEISGIADDGGFLDVVLPHELAHLIFRDLVGFNGGIPLWLDEGVATWAERGRRDSVSDEARRLARANMLIPLAQLMTMDIRKSKDSALVGRFYAQASSLVGFMVLKKGPDKFRKLCRGIRDGKDLNDALKLAYPDSIRSVGELQSAWVKYLLAEGKK